MRFQLFVLLFAGLTVLAGCPTSDDTDIEGNEAGECDDGVDNDQDGVTDCDDDGCLFAAVCGGGDDDTGGDDTGDDDDSTGDDTGDDDDSTGNVCVGDFDIEDQTDLDGVYGCTSISGDLRVDFLSQPELQDWLASLDLPNLEFVSGSLRVGFNDSLTSINMPALVEVRNEMEIIGNTFLPSLNGLSNLTDVGIVGGHLMIAGNDSLTSLEGLSSLASVGTLFITNNDCLSQADAEAFADDHAYGAVVQGNGANSPCP